MSEDRSAAGPATPSPVDLAELTLVEAELDKRWPETKIEPSLTRIAALMDLLGSPPAQLSVHPDRRHER